ncbi:MAG: histidinol dehydrogenase [Pelagibacteraceae bacterium]|jgi:histidinol dehydrogenase|nr:histidinol dehydrogenase [Pelagibacteraceae bacterium]
MLKLIKANQKNFLEKLSIILQKRKIHNPTIDKKVKNIIQDIKKNKDSALIKYEKRYSKIKNISLNSIKFSTREINEIIKKLDKKTKISIDLAFSRIFDFHKKQKLSSYSFRDKFKNSFAYKSRALNKVGVYVPGGRASYPSSVLMNCIPAIVAGVKEIYMTTPSMNNHYNPAVIYAAQKCRVKEIYKIGGAQAIAAMSYGTKIIQKVDKIVGPGNAFVANAKKQVFGEVGIDMIAGPSEVTIVADKTSKPDWIAADLIAQAEHDETSQSIVLADNINTIKKINYFLLKQLKTLPKKKIATKSLKNFGLSILATNQKLLIDTINLIAPEHLEIFTKNANNILKNVQNAGSIFLGEYSPEAIGDYLAGPNHVLPTSGSARFSSGLSVYDFLKRYSVIKMTKSGIERLGTSVINLAEYENLEGHANSIKIRLKKKEK